MYQSEVQVFRVHNHRQNVSIFYVKLFKKKLLDLLFLIIDLLFLIIDLLFLIITSCTRNEPFHVNAAIDKALKPATHHI